MNKPRIIGVLLILLGLILIIITAISNENINKAHQEEIKTLKYELLKSKEHHIDILNMYGECLGTKEYALHRLKPYVSKEELIIIRNH